MRKTKAKVINISPGDDANAAVVSYLKSYCDDPRELNFAVLLSGPWGSGKTFFLKNFLAERKEPHLYVSLYGVRTFTDIEDQLFRQLHPILSSKTAKLGGLLLKGIAKGVFKIDVNGDGSDEGSLHIGLPDIKLQEYLSDPKGRLLIFDDLERSAMPVGDILGFINAFVEHENIKAIIVANEAEIDRTDEKFKRVKEKLIGQTLALVPSIRSIMPALYPLLNDMWTKKFVQKYEPEVLKIFDQSKTHNIRALKQSLWDFEKFAFCLRPTDYPHEEVLLILLQNIVALSIEARTGKIGENDALDFHEQSWGRLFGEDNEPPNVQEMIMERYADINFRQSYLDNEVIANLLFKGWIDAKSVSSCLDRRPPFISPEKEEAWRRAWYAFGMDDADYDAAILKMRADFDARNIVDPNIFFHIFGILLKAARIGVISETTSQIVRACKAYIDDLLSDNRLPIPSVSEQCWIDSNYDGVGYSERDSAAFLLIETYYRNKVVQAQKANLDNEAAKLLNLMQSEPVAFADEIRLGGNRATYWQTAILHTLKPSIFGEALLTLNNSSQQRVFSALKTRYTTAPSKDSLKVELQWLRRVRTYLNSRRKSLPPLSKYRIGERIKAEIDPLFANSTPQ